MIIDSNIQHWLQVFELPKDEAISIAIEERNKAHACKDPAVKKEWLSQIITFEKHFGIGNDKVATEGNSRR